VGPRITRVSGSRIVSGVPNLAWIPTGADLAAFVDRSKRLDEFAGILLRNPPLALFL